MKTYLIRYTYMAQQHMQEIQAHDEQEVHAHLRAMQTTAVILGEVNKVNWTKAAVHVAGTLAIGYLVYTLVRVLLQVAS